MRALSTVLFLAACGSSAKDSAAPLPTEGTVKVLTYNVAGLPQGLASPERPTNDRMERIAPLLGDYDWIGLQEDFTDEGHARVLADATHPVQHWFDAVVAEDRALGSGLSVLVREAEQADYFEEHYTACNGTVDGASDCLASKGFQTLRLSLGGHELDIVNTHHEAGGGADDEVARTSQVDQVLASLDGRSAGRAIVFMGDFNMEWSDPPDLVELERYQAAGLRDACLELDCPEPDRIDRIWVRDSDDLAIEIADWEVPAGFVDEGGADLSDHEPVALTLSWSVR